MPANPTTPALPRTAIIIGAGVGGLATANLLAKAGVKVTVVEQLPGPGGRAGVRHIEGFTFDTGPSWYLMPEVFEHYFALLGEDVHKHLQLRRLDPAYKVFFEHHEPVSIRAQEAADAKTFEAIEPGAGAQLHRYLQRAATTYHVAVKHFLYNNFTVGRWLVGGRILRSLPRMARLAATPIHRYVGRFVKSRRLQQILEYPMVFLGTSPFDAPAIYSLMSHMDFKQGVYYPAGGLYSIVKALVAIGEELGVSYRYGTAVTAIRTSGRTATGIELADGTILSADIVISNADLHFTETVLVPPAARTYPAAYWRKRTPGPSALLMYLGVKGELPELAHHNLLFTDEWEQNFANILTHKRWPRPGSMYVCRPSATDTSVAPAGHENLFVLVPVPAKTGVGKLTAVADAYLSQLAGTIGVPNLKERLVVKELFGPDQFASTFNAWNGTALGMSHALGQSALFRPANRSRKLDNLYYVGAGTVPGIGLPMCLISAELILKRLTGDASDGPLPAPLGGHV